MQTAQPGDRVQVHYVKRLQGGGVASSRKGAPLELTVGVDHPRLPGLGMALVGLAPGARTAVDVPPERAYGRYDPERVFRLSRTRLAEGQVVLPGQWIHLLDRRGRRRLVRILRADGQAMMVDTNHPRAGRGLRIEVELLAIQRADTGSEPIAAH